MPRYAGVRLVVYQVELWLLKMGYQGVSLLAKNMSRVLCRLLGTTDTNCKLYNIAMVGKD